MSVKNNSSQKNYQKVKRTVNAKPLFLAIIFFISSVLVLPLLQSTQVNAKVDFAANGRIEEIDQRIKSLLYLDAISLCFKYSRLADGKDDSGGIEPSEVASGFWFTASDEEIYVPTSAYLLGTNRTSAWINCGEIRLPGFWELNPKNQNSNISSYINNARILCNSGFFPVGVEGIDKENKEKTVSKCIEVIESVSDIKYAYAMDRIYYVGEQKKPDRDRASSANDFYKYITQEVYGGSWIPDLAEADEAGDLTENSKENLYYFYLFTISKSCIPSITDQAKIQTNISYSGDNAYNNIKVLQVKNEGTENEVAVEATSNYQGDLNRVHSLVLTLPWNNAEMAGYTIENVDAELPLLTNDENFTIKDKTDDIYDEFFQYGNVPKYYSCDNLVGLMEEYLPGAIAAHNNRLKNNQSTVDTSKAAAVSQIVFNPESGDEAGTTTCAINGIGWIICPVVNFMSDIVDASWGLLVGFLQTSPSIVSTEKEDGNINSTYRAWQTVRNVANVAFVIVFLIIIFSQVTSFGISNYGIKKMLPKLIIAAILVNLSYYICQIAVDASNLLGYSIKSIFDDFASGISTSSPGFSTAETGDGVVGGISFTVLALAAGYAAWASIGLLIPVLLSGIVALIMILFMLIGRQALIVLLVILSPLAFVAYLLPNTEKLFDKWKKLSISLLMLFPIVALVMGASTLASTILTEVFTHSSTKGGFDETLGQIAGAAVAILPLFVVPGMLKKSLDGIGNIGGTLNKLSDKWGKGAGNLWTKSKLNQHMGAEKANKKARIQGGVYEGMKYSPHTLRSKIHKGINQAGWSGKYGDKMTAMGVSQADKFNDENVSLALSSLNNMDLTQAQNRAIATGKTTDANGKEITGLRESLKGINFNDMALKQAAIKQMVATNDVTGMNTLWDQTLDMDESQNSKYIRTAFANSMFSSSNKPAYFSAGAIASMKTHKGQASYKDVIANSLMANTYSPDKIAREDKDAIEAVNDVLDGKDENGKLKYIFESKADTEEKRMAEKALWDSVPQKLNMNASRALSDPVLSTLVSKNEAQIKTMLDITKQESNEPTTETQENKPTTETQKSGLLDQYGNPL